jgi:tetratricopeptide (TPR) repeat protein
MDLLIRGKRILLIACLTASFQFSFGQDFTKIIKAFQDSYTLETKKDYAGAVEKMKAVYDVGSYEINLRMGWLKYCVGANQESITYYANAIKLMPLSEEARFGIVYPLGAMGSWDLVIDNYKKILATSPNNTSAAYKLGYVYYEQKSYATAYTYFSKVVNLYPFGYEGLLMLAWTDLKLGKLNDAKVLFNKVLMYSPTDTSAAAGLKLIN